MSEPAPREMICFGVEGDCDRKRETRLSIAVVRTYVPFSPALLRVRCYSLGTKKGVCMRCFLPRLGKRKRGKHIRTSIDDWESARGWGRSEKMGEGVMEIAGLNGAPTGDAGILVGRLDDFGLRGSCCVLLVFSVFNACWREGISLWRASRTPPSPSR